MKRYQDYRNYTGDKTVPGENTLAAISFTVLGVFVLVAILFG